jgi:hypothetical protein
MRYFPLVALMLLAAGATAQQYPAFNQVWNISLGGDIIDVRDITGDGDWDITVALLREEGSYVYLLDTDGVLVWRNKISVIWPENTPGTVVVDDIDGNNNTNLVVGAIVKAKSCYGQLSPFATPVFVIERNPEVDTTTLKWVNRGYGYPITLDVADIGGDQKKEIIMGTRQGMVYALNSDGVVIWRHPTEGTVHKVKVADLNRDGRAEILVGTYKDVQVLDNTGRRLWTYPVGIAVHGIHASDITGDGLLEVLAVDNNHTLYALKADGKLLYTYNLSAIKSPIASGDFDGDGRNEVIIASADTVYAISGEGKLLYSHTVGYPIVDMAAKSLKKDGVDNLVVLGARRITNHVINHDFLKDVKAQTHLNLSRQHYEDKEYENAVENAEAALELYTELNDTRRIEQAQYILSQSEDNIRAKELYDEAQEHYMLGEYEQARRKAADAEKLYIGLRNLYLTEQALDLANMAGEQIDADYFLERAKQYYRSGEYLDGSVYASKALEMFERLENTEKADKARNIVENSNLYPKANQLYEEAMRHYEEKQYNRTLEKARESKDIYERLGDEGRVKTLENLIEKTTTELERLSNVGIGNRYMQYAQSKMDQSNFHGCVEDAKKSIQYYYMTGEDTMLMSAQAILARCERGIEAKKHMEKANELYIGEKYEEAIDYAAKARQIYRGIEDINSALTSSELILEIQEEQDRIKKQKEEEENWDMITKIAIVSATAIIAAVTAYFLALKKRKKPNPPEEEIPPEPNAEEQNYLDLLTQTQEPPKQVGEPEEETPKEMETPWEETIKEMEPTEDKDESTITILPKDIKNTETETAEKKPEKEIAEKIKKDLQEIDRKLKEKQMK